MFEDIIWSRAVIAIMFYSGVIGTIILCDQKQGRCADFNALDLLMENDKASKWSVIIMVAFGLSCVYTTGWWITGNLSWGDFMGFCGVWVTPLVVKMFVAQPERKEVQDGKPSGL